MPQASQQTLQSLKRSIDARLSRFRSLAERAEAEYRDLTDAEFANARHLLDEAEALRVTLQELMQ